MKANHPLNTIASVTMRLGLIMLSNGSSSSRADEAMQRVGQALGAERVEAYVTPTGIIASLYRGDEFQTRVERIRALGVNMQRIYEAELLLRSLKMGADPAQVDIALSKIEAAAPPYRPWAIMLACGLGCGSFAVLRGGGTLEFATAYLAAVTAQWVRYRLHRAKLRVPPTTVLCAIVASSLAILLVRVMNAPRPELGVIASVLLLVPGVPLVLSLFDLLLGNLVSGIARGFYALIVLMSIGVGVLISISLWRFTIL
jgi:uncharacterized membrane protein YjjP (DUF1212 family)